MSERIVLGCGNFGGIGSSPAFFGRGESEAEAFAIMDAAWDAGIRRFDTADAYGGGRSETMIGRWMASTGRRPRITTKTFNPMAPGADRGLGRDRVRRQLETSLERLGVERVDIYLAHEHDPEVPMEETIGAFEELVERGAIAAYGVSNFSAEQLDAALRAGRPRVVQNEFSLLVQRDAEDVIPLCARHGLEYQAFSPLGGGWLTGKYRRGRPFPRGSRMTVRPEPYAQLVHERTFAGLDRLAEAARARQTDTATLALAWALGKPGVSSVVVGPRRPDHLQPALRALKVALGDEEHAELGGFFG